MVVLISCSWDPSGFASPCWRAGGVCVSGAGWVLAHPWIWAGSAWGQLQYSQIHGVCSSVARIACLLLNEHIPSPGMLANLNVSSYRYSSLRVHFISLLILLCCNPPLPELLVYKEVGNSKELSVHLSSTLDTIFNSRLRCVSLQLCRIGARLSLGP